MIHAIETGRHTASLARAVAVAGIFRLLIEPILVRESLGVYRHDRVTMRLTERIASWRRRCSAPMTALLLAVGARALAAQSPASVVSAPDTTPAAVVRAYLRAYNAHDIEATLAVLAPDFVWLSVVGDSVTVGARGVEAIRAQLTDYFRALPSARSAVADLTALGPWVSATEHAQWTDRAGRLRSQASHSVYEVRGGRLRRVWYYPVVRP